VKTAVLCLVLTGCSPILSNAGQAVATGAIQGATSQASRAELRAAETEILTAARDETLSPETERKVQALVDTLLVDMRLQLTATRDVLLGDAKLTQEVAALRDTLLGASSRAELEALVRGAVDEALSTKTQGEVDALLDSAEPHLEMLVAEVIEGVTPELQASLKSTTAAAATDLASLKGYFVWVVAGLGGLLVLVLAIIVALIVMMRAHRKLSKRVRVTEWWRKD